MNSFYCLDELKKIGFASIGENVLISRKTSIYGAKNISIGKNVRIDDFCVLSGNITIGNNIHIAPNVLLIAGSAGIELHDFVGVSSRSAIYAESDDYSGMALTNPTINYEFRNIIKGKVILKKHSIIGTGTTILPNVVIEEGTAVGSMSLVNKSLDAWGIYTGIPCKKVKERSKHLLELEKEFYTKQQNSM